MAFYRYERPIRDFAKALQENPFLNELQKIAPDRLPSLDGLFHPAVRRLKKDLRISGTEITFTLSYKSGSITLKEIESIFGNFDEVVKEVGPGVIDFICHEPTGKKRQKFSNSILTDTLEMASALSRLYLAIHVAAKSNIAFSKQKAVTTLFKMEDRFFALIARLIADLSQVVTMYPKVWMIGHFREKSRDAALLQGGFYGSGLRPYDEILVRTLAPRRKRILSMFSCPIAGALYLYDIAVQRFDGIRVCSHELKMSCIKGPQDEARRKKSPLNNLTWDLWRAIFLNGFYKKPFSTEEVISSCPALTNQYRRQRIQTGISDLTKGIEILQKRGLGFEVDSERFRHQGMFTLLDVNAFIGDVKKKADIETEIQETVVKSKI